jgi:hypothetical protein
LIYCRNSLHFGAFAKGATMGAIVYIPIIIISVILSVLAYRLLDPELGLEWVGASGWPEDANRPPLLSYLKYLNASLAVVSSFGGAIIALLLNRYAGAMFGFLGAGIGAHIAQLLIAAVILVLGCLAYLFRNVNRVLYGAAEVTFSASMAFLITSNMPPMNPTISQWNTLAGCVYVVVRGLTNMFGDRK